jgi:hypothetical protein
MANYLGRNPAIGTQKLLDSIASQFDGILTTFDLRYSGTPTYPTLSAGLLVSLDGVLQEPSEAYYVSSDKIVFSAAPGAGTECWILLYSEFGVVSDHGLLSGLADDDHAQYLHTTLDRAGIAANISTTGNLGGANLTLTGELRGPSTLVIDPAAVGDDTGLVRIKGGLEVLGTTTTIASTALTVADKNIVIAQGGSTLSSIDEAGIDFGSTAVRVRYNYNAGVASGLSIEGGNVGIGSSSPLNTLNIVDSASVHNGTIRLGSSTYYSTITQDAVTTGKLAINSVAASGSVHGIQLQVDGTAALAINSSRQVGIGTSSPGAPLEVIGTAGTISARATTGVSSQAIQIYNNGTDSYIDSTAYGAGSGGGIVFRRNGSVEMGRWDTSGRLLVGTSSTAIACRQVLEGSSSTQAGIQILAANTSSPADGSALGAIYFADNTHASGLGICAEIFCRRDGGTWSASSKPTRLVFSTTADGASSSTERMRISQQGVHWLFSSDDIMRLRTSNGAGTVYAFIRGYHSGTGTISGGTQSLTIWNNGNIVNTNGSYTAISDAKLKENIVDASSQWDDLKTIQIRNWNFKAETGHETHRQIGPIAQELETICPGLVFETPDRDEDGNDLGTVTKSVNYSVLYMKAVKALQEAMERIETLEGMVAVNNITIDEQQHQLSTLAARLTALESA